MSVKVEIIFNEPVVEILKDMTHPNMRAMAVRDVLLSNAHELVAQIAQEGLENDVTITKHVGLVLTDVEFEEINEEE